jgi:amino acid transporter
MITKKTVNKRKKTPNRSVKRHFSKKTKYYLLLAQMIVAIALCLFAALGLLGFLVSAGHIELLTVFPLLFAYLFVAVATLFFQKLKTALKSKTYTSNPNPSKP